MRNKQLTLVPQSFPLRAPGLARDIHMGRFVERYITRRDEGREQVGWNVRKDVTFLQLSPEAQAAPVR